MKNILECERRQIEKYLNINLPNKYRKLGVIVSAMALLALISFKFIENEPMLLRDIIKKLILVGLLIFAISKDKVEDEMTVKLRGQAFTMAFIFGVIYSIAQPYITYLLAGIFGKEDRNDLLELGDFQLMVFMLMIQIGFYWMLKKYR